MFAKPFSLVLVYVVTVFNLLILVSPIIAVAAPFMHFSHGDLSAELSVLSKMKLAFFLVLFLVSFLMLGYLFLDFLFGFSMRAALKNCTRYEKIKDYDFLTDIFDQVKNKFGEKSVKLYVKNSDEINAYAVSSLGGKAIVLTRGLVNHYLVESRDPKGFIASLRSIMGHEMSHLINKDFLPTFLIITNQKATNFISKIMRRSFGFLTRIIGMVPYGGRLAARAMNDTYTLINFFITFFNRFVVYNIYEFLRRFISRSIEYRCDRQSAKAFGGQSMAQALSMLGESGYFTLFSTHPGTKARMKKVENVKWQEFTVRPGFFDTLANYFSLMFLVVVCLIFAKQAHIDWFVRQYLNNHELINSKLSALWRLISRFY